MKVEQNGKTLYHIQNLNMGSDGYPFDAYVFSDHELTQEDLRKVFDIEWGDGYKDNEESGKYALEEWLTSSEIYKVYAEEI